jgi:Uma2 family endonuclease
MSIQKKLYTYAEFEQIAAQPDNRDRRLELIHGELIDVSPSFSHGKISFALLEHFVPYNKKHGRGQFLIEVRYKLPGDDHNAMIPDLSYVENADNMPTDSRPVPRMPDLAVEIQSPDDSPEKIRTKCAYYVANGSKLAWGVFLKKQIEVYRPGEEVIILDENDTLDGGDVLPGFSLVVRDLFA